MEKTSACGTSLSFMYITFDVLDFVNSSAFPETMYGVLFIFPFAKFLISSVSLALAKSWMSTISGFVCFCSNLKGAMRRKGLL